MPGSGQPVGGMRLGAILGRKPFVCFPCGVEFDEGEVHVCREPVPDADGFMFKGMPFAVARPVPPSGSLVIALVAAMEAAPR